MPIIIKTEKCVKDGIKGRKILFAKALRDTMLPSEYKKSYPYVRGHNGNSNGIVIEQGGKSNDIYIMHNILNPESFFPEGKFQKLLEIITKCGERLTKINSWSGRETFTI